MATKDNKRTKAKGRSEADPPMIKLQPGDVLLSVEEAAVKLRTSKSTLGKWRVNGSGPPFVRLEHGIRYVDRLCNEWLEQRVIRSTAELTTTQRGDRWQHLPAARAASLEKQKQSRCAKPALEKSDPKVKTEERN